MKTILAPTDFSTISLNAIDYAAEMAKLTDARLILLHTYHVPVITSEYPVVLPSLDEMDRDALKELKIIEKRIHARHGKQIKLESLSICGFAEEEIEKYSTQHGVDLIIMGMQGAGYLSEKLIGSVTTTLMRRSKVPVLAIDKNVQFRSIKKIALACDLKEIKDHSILKPLKEFVRLFKSHVYVVNVVKESEALPETGKAIEGVNLEHALEDIEHSYHFDKNKNVIDGITHFVNEQKMDMLVMIPRDRSVWSQLFAETHTKQMAFHIDIPLLSIHE